MDFNTYSRHALCTAKLFGDHHDFIHATLGLTSEMDEVLRAIGQPSEKMIDENGDVMWYWNLACCSLKLEHNSVLSTAQEICRDVFFTHSPSDRLVVEALRQTATLADMAKKALIANKPIKVDVAATTLSVIAAVVLTLLHRERSDLGTALDCNIEKLTARYPNLKFEAERMNNVNRTAEAAAQSNILRTHDARGSTLHHPTDAPKLHHPGETLHVNNVAMMASASAANAADTSHVRLDPVHARSENCTPSLQQIPKSDSSCFGSSDSSYSCSSSDSGSCGGGGGGE